ncbi:MAG: selenide, water dikinase SelD, partial [Kamptonema sp. SIO4C4]|nr:selenide, water dikinase SelD [Kamptonema sp. SIO4C4]
FTPTPKTLDPCQYPVLVKDENTEQTLFKKVCQTLQNPPLAETFPSPQTSKTNTHQHYLQCFLNDPYLFGKLAVNESFNPLWAIGATPQTVLTSVIFPCGSPSCVEALLRQVLAGVCQQLQQTQTTLMGGHSTQGQALALSVVCHHHIEGQSSLAEQRLEAGQSLILTQAIGTGTLFTADRQYQAKGRWIQEALHSLLFPQQSAMHILQEYGATACAALQTRGLLGHLLTLRGKTPVQLELNLSNLPIFDGALESVAQGITHPNHLQNQRYGQFIDHWPERPTSPTASLLFDPQVAGGLLAALPSNHAQSCLIRLQTAGYSHSRIIGHVSAQQSTKPVIVL